MGITGLLPYLEKATRPCHISEFRGCTVAVDSYCLLHRGANACAEQLARGEDSRLYVDYCVKFINMLLKYNIHPILVFDGQNLPAKAQTDAKRRESRKKAKQRAAELLKLGKSEEARTYLKQCIDITPKMAHNLIKECHTMNVDCIVAPYESDAQMAFLNIKGIADCVITEDSDLVLFGCSKALYKLDLSGQGRLVEAEKINLAMKMRPDQYTFEKFRYMCILSGCDYISSLSGIGLKKAEKFIKLTVETNPEIFLDKIPRYLNMKHLEVTREYKEEFLIANATFLHQVVYNPFERKLVHLTDPDIRGTKPAYLVNAGVLENNIRATQVALGNLNPYNFEQYDDWHPSKVPNHSIWSKVYQKRISATKQKQLQKDILENFVKGKNVKSKSSEEAEEEEVEVEQDLSMYLKKPATKENMDTKTTAKEDNVEIKSRSPLSLKNPFFKNKLSKFPKSKSCDTLIVKSRFFEDSVFTILEPSNNETISPDNENSENITKNFYHLRVAPIANDEEIIQEKSAPVTSISNFAFKIECTDKAMTIERCGPPTPTSELKVKENQKNSSGNEDSIEIFKIRNSLKIEPADEDKDLSFGTYSSIKVNKEPETIFEGTEEEEILVEPDVETVANNSALSNKLGENFSKSGIDLLGEIHDGIIMIDSDDDSIQQQHSQIPLSPEQPTKKRKLNNRKSKQTSLHSFFHTIKKQ